MAARDGSHMRRPGGACGYSSMADVDGARRSGGPAATRLSAPSAAKVLSGRYRLADTRSLIGGAICGWCDALDALGDDIDVAITPLKAPPHHHERFGAQDRAVALVAVGVHDDVGHPGFVFDQQK